METRQKDFRADSRLLKSFSLLFDSDDLNSRFNKQFNKKNVNLIRMTFLIGAFLYITFGFLDRYIVPDTADDVFIIRIICTGFLLFMFSLPQNFSVRYVQLITFLSSLICGIGIVVMILISEANGGYYYYAGLLLVIWYSHGPLRMRFILATAVSVTLTLSYILAVFFIKTTPFDIVLNNTFFIVSANILGMFSSYGLEYYSRIAFWKEEQFNKIKSELEAEYQRKTKELEDARQIQLSMLPSCNSDLADLDICFDMRTATEVGGDYYDYKISDNGSIILVLGDATGHGMRAGILVSIIKALFLTYKDDMDPNSFLNNCSRIIKKMHLGNLYMSLLLLKYKDGNFCVTSAGIPPLFIYRSATGEVEALIIKGMPLGAFESFTYQQVEKEILPGDVVLLMTDGYPELFNEKNETLDYDRVRRIFCSTIKSSANEIAAQLFIEGDKWRGKRPQHDDITFIVFKRREKMYLN